MATNSAVDDTGGEPMLKPRNCTLKQKNCLSKPIVGEGEEATHQLAARPGRGSDAPIAVETFERERMGIAAKE
jgi:hypothetical protein